MCGQQDFSLASVAITDESFGDYDKLQSLYERAFPPEERAPLDMLTRPEWHGDFRAFYADGVFCGLAYLLVSCGNCYLFYLAVEDRMRGRGIGSSIIREVRRLHPNERLVLEMEALDPEAANYGERLQRAAFYERNGLHRTGVTNSQCGVLYEVMSDDQAFSLEQYSAMWHGIMRQQGKAKAEAEEWLRRIFGDSILY